MKTPPPFLNELWPLPQWDNPTQKQSAYLAACRAGNLEYQRTGSVALAEKEWMRVRTAPNKELDTPVNPS